jgi:hydroxymethylglutaryl-CoA lyase
MMFDYPKSVVIEEQGLRDGLQSEGQVVPTAKKLEIINAMIRAGIKRIQVTSLVVGLKAASTRQRSSTW